MKTPGYRKQSPPSSLFSSIHHTDAEHRALVLPNDITHEILSQFDAEREENPTPMHYTYTTFQLTLSTLCLLNKEWNAEATHRLYKDVFIHSTHSLSLFVRTLDGLRDIGRHVRSFFFLRVRAEDSEHRFSREYRLYSEPGIESDIRHVFRLCPKLQFRKPATSYFWTTARDTAQEWHRLDASNVTHLELSSMYQPLSQMVGLAPSLPSLEELIVTSAASGFRGREFGWPDMPRLRRLCLLGCLFVTDDAPLTLPRCSDRLHTLEIIGGQYDPGVFWSEVRSLTDHIEHLALLSRSFTICALIEGQLDKFPFLTSLRMMATHSMGYRGVSIPLPLQVVHLTIIADQHINPSVTWNVEDSVRKQVKAKRNRRRRADCRWETVLFAGIPDKHIRTEQKTIRIMAGRVGVKFTESYCAEHGPLDGPNVKLFRH